ncbi:hypothetical protein [Tenuibacillus multivorans]|nr:hypothetical protein [Tenuibacillus multivorans]GEL77287.1 hypothetical protein TMU01_15220 [Tenuibacillus multivorans]
MKKHQLVTKEMYLEQLKWSVWFMVFLILARVGYYVLASFRDELNPIEPFISFSADVTVVYMLVIGLFSTYAFLGPMVSHGISRRDYYQGTIFSLIGLTGSFFIATVLLSLLETIAFQLIDPSISISSAVLTTYAEYVTALFFSYIIGWFITLGFYRYAWLKGLGFILLALSIQVIFDWGWGESVSYFGINLDETNFSFLFTIILSMFVSGLTLWLIWLVVRNIPVRM